MELITSHLNSDFDSLGAMIGAKKLYPEALCSFPGSQEKTLRQFFINATFYASNIVKARTVNLDEVTRLILVDVSSGDRIGRFGPLVDRADVDVHVYDHHGDLEPGHPATVRHVERVGAATTILVEILRQRRIPIDPAEATIMLLGIFEDTGGLTFVTTTPRDYDAAGYLLSQGADLSAVREFITPELTAVQVALLDDLFKNREVHRVHGVEVTVTSVSTDEYVGDLAVLAHKMCDMEQIGALLVYARMGDRVHLVGRSRIPEVDVGAITRHFGGGGHPEAASASIRDRTPLQVHDELTGLLPRVIKPRVTARHICTAPVKTVKADDTLAEVRNLLNRYHINVVPVMRGARVVGILTRIVIERATQHGLEGSKAEEYMSSEFSSVSPDTPLSEVRELVVGGRQRFMPVIDGGELIGALTRTDLLQALTPSSDSAIYRSPRQTQVRHAKKMIEDVLSAEVIALLKTVGEMAVEVGMRAYLVGGMVRDLILRQPNVDIDIVVEGDGIELARRIGRRLGATVRPHKLFGTAKLIFPDGLDLDIATARTEYYHEPAALPSVEQSSLKLDLSRRDFTMNSLALRLEPDSFGEVIDFFGGFSDIKNRTIRILHNLSFVEDPTRIMRATRFSLRFGFELGSQTRKFLSASVRNGFLAQARGPRLLRELRMVLEECDPVEALETLEELGVLAAFHPKMHYRGKSLALTQAVVEVLAWFELLYHEREVKPWMLFIMALLTPLEVEEARAWAREFGVADREGGDLIEAVGAARETLEKLTKVFSKTDAPPQSKIHGACVETGTEALLFAMAATRDERKRRAISLYFTRLSSISTIVSGGDLKELGIPPGPVYRELLGGLLDHKLDTRITTRREELAWVADERKKRGI